jgi:carbonic anhydrase/acetyltransferase-like protein (isoleucine patch superfamily)
MLESFDGKAPKIAESAYVHPFAFIRGDVEIGEHSIIWPGASITADLGALRIGKCATIEDNCLVHVGTKSEIGNYVIIGHGAVVHGKKIGNHVLIGMNATILQHVEIGNECVIAAGSVVTERMKIPDRSFVAGVPAKIKGGLTPNQTSLLGTEFEGDDSYYIEWINKLKASVVIK